MQGYKLTTDQMEKLKYEQYDDSSYFNPIQDADGEWFIFQEEYEAGYDMFEFFRDLIKTEFIPKPTTFP